jgi:type I restriction enzyme R subunit
MNEAETRAELIDPKLKENGWDGKANPDVKVHREYPITLGKIKASGGRSKPLIADYVLAYKNRKLAVVEAKSDECEVGEGVGQAKDYAAKLKLDDTYSTNGLEIYHIDMDSAKEGLVENFHTPEQLYNKAVPAKSDWQQTFDEVPEETKGGTMGGRFYQEIAVEKALDAIAEKKNRILLTLATGTGKTFIAFQIAWKLFQTRWNLSSTSSDAGGYVARRPRILFLADRNILADQAFNAFSSFPEDALVRIKPNEIRKKGRVPTNGSIFFTIFQTFMSGASSTSTGSVAGEYTSINEESASGESVSGESVSELVELTEVTDIEPAYGYMYILECADGSFYTGSTKDLTYRLEQHRNGEGANHTRKQLPVKLVYYEKFDRIAEAFEREKQVQGWSRAKKIALIKRDYNLLKKLSKSHSTSTGSVSGKATFEDCSQPVAEPAEATVGVPYFGEYPPDYFDLIVIDECHRGGANDESTWRSILEYFKPAVQIGLTATPKRNENVDTYKYFGNPVYIYSLKDGINDGFLTPFKVKKITSNLDEYTYQTDDTVVEGEIEEGRVYTEADFNRIIEIKAREEKRVRTFMNLIDQNEKTLVFCATQDHAAAVRDLINQYTVRQAHGTVRKDVNYCVRVTANDGELGEHYLREFQDNERSIPTILTTSQKLSTGVDARNVRNIVLLRPVNNIVEFKQIVGRGTRLFEGKNFFTIYDFVNASERFKDPEWDGEPIEPVEVDPTPTPEPDDRPPRVEEDEGEFEKRVKIKVKLGKGKEHTIEHSVSTSFIGPDGKPMTVQEFIDSLFGKFPDVFNNEDELRRIWSNPLTRKTLLEKLSDAGFGIDELHTLQKIVDAEKSDLFDVLEFIAFAAKPITREERVAKAQSNIFAMLEPAQKEFLEFVLTKYIETGVEELDNEKLPDLLELKYHAISDAAEKLGGVAEIRDLFLGFQRWLYEVA